jgi:WS/DGAT/MGAT family acyltransferase
MTGGAQMRRLSGLESFFVSAETPTNLFHVGAVAVLDPSTVPAGTPPPHEALTKVLAERMHLLAPFRRRLFSVPGGLDHAYWVEEGPVDLHKHVIRGALPQPGGMAELARYAGDVMGRPLDRDRPLWEIHVVEGLEDGLVAAIAKIHHAAIDGLTGIELTANLMDFEPYVQTSADLSTAPPPLDETPSSPLLTLDAVRHLAGRIPAAAGMVTRTARLAGRLRLHGNARDDASAEVPGLLDAPRTELGGRLTHRRAVAMASIERESIDKVRAATGVTVNDVILTLTSSMLRGHLDDAGVLPPDPLVAFVPVAVRDQRGKTHDECVNRLSGMLVSLATDTEDPLERLVAVSRSARQAKAQDRQVGGALFGSLAELLVPLFAGALERVVLALGPVIGWPPFNVVVSSFPGSPAPLYCAGSKLLAYYPLGPVVDGSSLNVTVTTYRDQVAFGLLACEDKVPDVDAIAGRLHSSMRELVKLTEAA